MPLAPTMRVSSETVTFSVLSGSSPCSGIDDEVGSICSFVPRRRRAGPMMTGVRDCCSRSASDQVLSSLVVSFLGGWGLTMATPLEIAQCLQAPLARA